MSEEDEIRDAVVALLKAQESGQDVSELLPSPEGFPAKEAADAPAQTPEQALASALARALAFVRTRSRASQLVTPSDWAEAGLVPESLDPEDVEMAVYDRLMAYKETCDLDESLGDRSEEHSAVGDTGGQPGASLKKKARSNPHTASAFSSSPGRPVGLSGFKHRATEGAGTACEKPAPSSASDLPTAPQAPDSTPAPSASPADSPTTSASSQANAAPPNDPAKNTADPLAQAVDAAQSPLEAVEEQGGESPSAQSPRPAPDAFADCRGIRLLMGAHSYYLYDEAAMTDTYARWAFLAAEDDPVATFLECVRDESRIYPRPLARVNLENPPFRMDAETAETAYRTACDQGRADDVQRIEATNGAVYFYSTDYLSPARAQSLAQYDAVERAFNV
uniref:Uncharacterized protein n=1 Tax=Muribaculaceae bacterium Z82 TaxID=2304548 RepID=A0A7C9NRS0_9BACT